MFKLKWPAIPSPFWFAAGRNVHDGYVREDGTVSAESDVLTVIEGNVPPAGTRLRILKDRLFLTAETVPDYETRVARVNADRQALASTREEQVQQRYAERQQRLYEQASATNGKLNVPVRWTSGLKMVLSGLSASSNGSGDNARSVSHILLLDPVSEGRFQRSAKSFLCTSSGGSNGQAWTDKLDTHSTGQNGPYVSAITCKQCLKLAQRWNDASTRVEPELVK